MNRYHDALNNAPFLELDQIKDRHGEVMAFVEFQKPNRMIVWVPIADKEVVLRAYNVTRFEQPILEEVKVWKKLSEEIQGHVINWGEEHKEEMRDRMAHARKGRKEKYPELPDELVCSKCGKPTKIQKSQLAKRIEKKGVIAADYIKDYTCRSCTKKNYEGMLDKLVCKCGYEVKYHPSMIIKMAEKKGISVEELAASYQCQTCNPTKGRKGRRKK